MYLKEASVYLVSAIFILFCSCSGSPEDKAAGEKQALISRVDSISKKMFDQQNMELNRELALAGISAFRDYITKYPGDTLSAEYLFRMADLQQAIGDHKEAINSLAEICNRYPEYRKVPESIFLQGYYFQEFFRDTANARYFYHRLITRFPNHGFADDARVLMSMFGKTEEEIVREFEAKQGK